jgi:uncharacterized protein YbjT (DUF2867 family)
MDIAVPGGTGTLGRAVVAELVGRGHHVRILTRSAPPRTPPGARHHTVDVVTGAGLREALDGADAVIDATNTPGSGRRARPVIVQGTQRVLAAEADAGIRHHVAISIVGIDTVALSYYRTKLEQEELVAHGPVPWSILRATQFHQLLELLFTATARARVVPGSGFAVAPVDPRFVARALADAAQAGPGGRRSPVAGPQTAPLGELARDWAWARGRRVVGVPLPLPRRARRALRDGALVPDPGVALSGGASFGEWVRDRDHEPDHDGAAPDRATVAA